MRLRLVFLCSQDEVISNDRVFVQDEEVVRVCSRYIDNVELRIRVLERIDQGLRAGIFLRLGLFGKSRAISQLEMWACQNPSNEGKLVICCA